MNPANVAFETLNQAVKHHGLGMPCSVVDMDALDRNISRVKRMVHPSKAIRLVAKSLPAAALLRHLGVGLGTTRTMAFHLPFIHQIADTFHTEEPIMMGKPLPTEAVERFVKSRHKHVPVLWMVDSVERLQGMLGLARKLNVMLHVVFEVDVGLCRGGFDAEELRIALGILKGQNEQIKVDGMVAYEAHLPSVPVLPLAHSIPGIQDPTEKVLSAIRSFKSQIEQAYGPLRFINTGGSLTFERHGADSVANEIALGSCLLMPSEFDVESLKHFEQAVWIAAPILKKMKGTQIPGIGGNLGTAVQQLSSKIPSRFSESYFIYGGRYDAEPAFPEQASWDPVLGKSYNQACMHFPHAFSTSHPNYGEGDHVFFRPWQSENNLMRFGHMLLIKNGKVIQDVTPFSDRFEG